MVRENLTTKKTRYISISQNGMEIYTETISSSGKMRDYLVVVRLRLHEIERVIPMGKWSMKIEQQWPEGSVRHYQVLDVTTGKLQESVL